MSARIRVGLVGGLLTSALLAVVVTVLVLTGNRSLSSTAIVLCIDVMLVVSLQSFVGTTGILSFGHVAFMGIGAFATALLTIPPAVKKSQLPNLPAALRDGAIPWPAAVLVGALLSLVVAAVVGLLLVRMTTSAMVMATFALLITTYTVLLNIPDWTRGGSGVFGVPRALTPWLSLGLAVLFVVLVRLLGSGRLGLQGRAVREDELAAASVGIDVRRNRFLLWIISAALMGAAGGLWALTILAFDAGQFSFATTFALLAMLVIGGRASVLGATLGAGLVVLVTELLSRVEQGLSIGGFELPRVTGTVQFVLAALIIVTLIWKPAGITGQHELEDLVPALRQWRDRALLDVETADPPDGTGSATPGATVLAGSSLARAFRGVRAVDGIDIEVRRGEILGLIGPNGSGKSTVLNLLSGITAPDSGTVVLVGDDVTSRSVHDRARRGLGRTFQNIRLFPHLTVLDNVVAPHGADPARSVALLDVLGLRDVAATEAGTLSYGRQRRLEIARALAGSPAVILMDEPAAGMNEEESDVLLADIRTLAEQHRCGVVIIDHDLRLIMRLCDRIQVLETGRTIAVGTPTEVSADPAVRAAYLGDAVGAEGTDE